MVGNIAHIFFISDKPFGILSNYSLKHEKEIETDICNLKVWKD